MTELEERALQFLESHPEGDSISQALLADLRKQKLEYERYIHQQSGRVFQKVLYYFQCDRCGQKGEEREKPDEAHADHKAHFEAIV